jgi:hypothetical protein
VRWLALASVVACAPTPTPTPTPSPSLAAHFEPSRLQTHDSQSAKLVLVLENHGARTERVNRFVLGVPQLSLEVLDAAGKARTWMSPPVPHAWTDADFADVAGGARLEIPTTLHGLSAPLDPGTYEVRSRDYPAARATVVVTP